MCGIVGFIGGENVVPVLLAGLTKLEYRGYDSAGIALQQKNELKVIKSKGRLSVLKEKMERGERISSMAGIGHTRWATHGEPNDVNSHPHLSHSCRFAVVHNGIIENYKELKEKLEGKGYVFLSQTDTEVIAHLLEYYYRGDLVDAVLHVQNKLEGSYALGVLSLDYPDEIIAVRKDSPLVVGMCAEGALMASDIPALLPYTRDFYELSEKEIVILKKEGIQFFDVNREPVHKTTYHVDWDMDSASLCGYEHFMIKEIMEQPKALKDTISAKIKQGEVDFASFSLTREELQGIDRFYVVACGSAAHAGMVGKQVIQQLARMPVEVELASEFRYQEPLISERTFVLVVSQSGETADSLAALKYAKAQGAKTLAIVNVVGSAIAKAADQVIYTNAGPEISVATTKAYSCQLAVLYLLAIYLGRKKGTIDDQQNQELLQELLQLPEKVEEVLQNKDKIQYLASRHYHAKDVFFIGRNLDYAAALEASLKLKEISYIHSEAYAAGELKHGTIALVEDGTLIIAVAVNEKMFDKLSSNIQEVQARGADVLTLTWEGNGKVDPGSESVFFVPRTAAPFSPTLTIIPLQIFAYYVASMKGLDIDKPRNLAKSVTVE